MSKRIGKSAWVPNVPTGSLVRPLKKLYLTPVTDDPDGEDWPEWFPEELGIVLPPYEGLTGVYVLTPRGYGMCFADEIFVLRGVK